jgi:hypothetical protein
VSPDSTTILMLLTAAIWLVWDVALYVYDEETISEKMYKASKTTMMVPFVFGVLCGHWFW